MRVPQHMEGISDLLEKFNKTFKKIVPKEINPHRIVPRELSPTRMINKYVDDKKKAGVAKVQKVADASAAQNEAADELLARQLETLRAALPTAPATLLPSSPASSVPVAARSAGPDYLPWVVGGGAVLAALLLLRSR